MAGTLRIDDIALSVTERERCPRRPARFVPVTQARARNPFLGWHSKPVLVRSWHLRDVVLDRELMVLLKDGQVVGETDYLQAPECVAAASVAAERLDPLPFDGPVAGCFDHWDGNYFHWFRHSLPAIEMFRGERLGLLVPELTPMQRQTLEGMMAPDRLVPLRRDRQYAIRDMIWTDVVAGRADFAVSATARAAFRRLSDMALPAAAVASTSPSRLYIDRRAAAGRRIPNEDALVDALAQQGFSIVRLERLSVADQVALFRSAQIVVGQHGAGLTNIAFCQPGTIVYELVPDHYRNPCFLALAVQGELAYWADTFPTGLSAAEHAAPWVTGIDVAHVLARIEELESASRMPFWRRLGRRLTQGT